MTSPLSSSPSPVAHGAAPTGAVTTPGAEASRAKLVEAARQFDAVFVRIVLSSLQKTTKMGGSSGLSAGQSTYGAMVVDTVSDAVTRAGGTGLADRLLDALGPRLAAPKPGAAAVKPGVKP